MSHFGYQRLTITFQPHIVSNEYGRLNQTRKRRCMTKSCYSGWSPCTYKILVTRLMMEEMSDQFSIDAKYGFIYK